MSKLYVFLLSCASITCGFNIQIQALHYEYDNNTEDMVSALLSLNNSSVNGDHGNIYSEIDSLINATALLGINLDSLSRNESETETLYVPAFSIELQDHENEFKNPSENVHNIRTFSSNATDLNINGNIPNVIYNQTDFMETSALNNNDSYLFGNTNQTTLKSMFEDELNFTHEHNDHASEDMNFKLNVSKLKENSSFIIHCPVFVPHSLTHKIDVKFSILNESMEQHELSKLFESLLRQALHEKTCESMVPLSLIHGAHFIYSWTNSSANSEYCDNAMLTNIESKVFNKSGLSNVFSEIFLPFFRIENVTILKLGICTVDTQQIDSGTVAVVVVCALTLLPCCFLACFKFIHYRKCRTKTETVLKPRFPMIFDSDNFTTKSYGPTHINLAFEEEIQRE